MREFWNRLWEWAGLPHLLLLLIALVTPSVAGALGGPIRGVLLGGGAMLFWLLFGCLSHRGIIAALYHLAGMIVIYLQLHHQLALAKALQHPPG